MSFRSHLSNLQDQAKITTISSLISPNLEIAGLLKQLEPRSVQFNRVAGSPFLIAGNLFCTKNDFAAYFDIPVQQIIPFILNAIEHPSPCPVVHTAPCQEVIISPPNLDALPILRYCESDGGNYISSGVMVARHPRHGQNLDFHRLMQFSPTEMAVRIVRNRHFDSYLRELNHMDVAVCIGLSPAILAAAATSVDLGIDELTIANTMETTPLVHATTVDLWIPAESEFVLEGTVYIDRTHPEGPFVDLTETYDVVREEPVLEVKAITHRKDAIWHALLPGGLEHKLLMGMPREPTIFKKVNEVVRCLDVNITPGGCSWLHAVVQIQKHAEMDGRNAIEAAFSGHTSLKHVYIVDEDIDIYNPNEVEWAMATRFQGDRDLIIKGRETGSSLDPSAEPGTHLTTKIGYDLTKPLSSKGKSFKKVEFPKTDLSRFIKS